MRYKGVYITRTCFPDVTFRSQVHGEPVLNGLQERPSLGPLGLCVHGVCNFVSMSPCDVLSARLLYKCIFVLLIVCIVCVYIRVIIDSKIISSNIRL